MHCCSHVINYLAKLKSRILSLFLIGQLLQLMPVEEIIFRREDGETTGLLTMTNAVDCSVAYKVSCTLQRQPTFVWQNASPYLFWKFIDQDNISRQIPSPSECRSHNKGRYLKCYSAHPIWLFCLSAGTRQVFGNGLCCGRRLAKCPAVSRSVESKCCFPHFEISTWFLKTCCCEQKIGDASVQQHRLRCSVAPSDAHDDFSGDKQQAASLKLLQEMAPRMEALANGQEKLLKQVKQMRILLVILLLALFALPFYLFPNSDVNNQTCRVLPSSS